MRRFLGLVLVSLLLVPACGKPVAPTIEVDPISSFWVSSDGPSGRVDIHGYVSPVEDDVVPQVSADQQSWTTLDTQGGDGLFSEQGVEFPRSQKTLYFRAIRIPSGIASPVLSVPVSWEELPDEAALAEQASAPPPKPQPKPEPEPGPGPPEPAVIPSELRAVAEAFGSFKPSIKTGTGDSVVKLPRGATLGLVTAKHVGSSNFVLQVLDERNSQVDLLVNTIGRYSGTTLYSTGGGTPTKIKISADGSWRIRFAPVSRSQTMGALTNGDGDSVLLYSGGPADWVIKHKGSDNFVVQTIDTQGSGDLLVNEIGKYGGTIPVGEGPSVVKVTADGAWSIKVR